jgi:YVTN family beta-propeller protein
MKAAAALAVAVSLLALTILRAGPAWAALSETAIGGPGVIQMAALSASPSPFTIVNAGCGASAQQTQLNANWSDSQSPFLDASGSDLVAGYTLSRATSSTGPFGTALKVSGNPPATTGTDSPPVPSTGALIGDATPAGSRRVYPYSESTRTVGAGIPIGVADSSPNALQITPDGLTAVLAEARNNRVQVLTWSGTTWSVARTFRMARATAVAISPTTNAAGHYVAFVATVAGAFGNGTVVPVTLNGGTSSVGTPIAVQREAAPTAITVTPDGTEVFVANYNSGTVSAITVSTATVATIPLPGAAPRPFALTSTPDSSHVYVADRGNGYVDDISVASNAVGTHVVLPAGALNDTALANSGDPSAMAMLPSGKDLYIAEFGSSQVQEIATALAPSPDTVAATVSTGAGSQPIDLAMGPNGCTLFVADWSSNSILEVATTANTESTAFTTACRTQDPQPMAVTPDNGYLLVPENARCGDLQVYNTGTGAVTTLASVGAYPAQVGVQPADLWYEVTATHLLWSSLPSLTVMVPVGWNPGGWQ